MKLKKGDNIIVTAGRDKGKKGVIQKTFREQNRVLIDGINVMKRHEKSRTRGGKGQTVERAMPINASNVMIFDSKSGKGTRIGSKMEDGKKVRIAKKSGNKI